VNAATLIFRVDRYGWTWLRSYLVPDAALNRVLVAEWSAGNAVELRGVDRKRNVTA